MDITIVSARDDEPYFTDALAGLNILEYHADAVENFLLLIGKADALKGDVMELLTKSSAEKLSEFLCPDYGSIAMKFLFFELYGRILFRKPTFSAAPSCRSS